MFFYYFYVMEMALEQLSKQQLINLLMKEKQAVSDAQKTILKKDDNLAKTQEEVFYLKAQIEQYKRMLFGQKRERFEGDNSQLPLPFAQSQEQIQHIEELVEEKIEIIRKKKASSHKGRIALPAHLPVEEIEIHPEGDLSEMVCIGSEVTEELECVPTKFYIKRYIRYKYAPKNNEGVLIASLPERAIDKGIPGAGLLATILTDKYMDHLPLYRQRQRFLREDILIAASTLDGWAKQALEKLEPLYLHLLADTKAKGYLQVDETTIRVLESNKKGACHLGYYWVYHSPIDKTVLFDYHPTRSGIAPETILNNFKGYLQTDGYTAYEKIGQRKDIVHLACWAHARREFDKALVNDKQRAQTALSIIQELYGLEQKAREDKLTPAERKELRLEKSLPVINKLGNWIAEEIKAVLPKSQIGKAMRYSLSRWDELSAYLNDGTLEIDNNLVENAIRPVALGRKNYLFAGSHEAAQRAAMVYSFFAICKKHQVNPYQWLKYTLENIMTINHKEIRNLYPQNFKNNM
jgi:transposase